LPDPSVVSLVHLGCARNLVDSELILGRLAEEGLIVAGDPEQAGTVVLNTCSFIGPAREESERVLQGLLAKKARGEIERVVVAGCLVQRFRRELVARFPAVDLFAEISDGRELARSVRAMVEGRSFRTYLESPGLREPERDGARLLATPGSYAYLRISHGCDHGCAFCAIPAIRGPHRSKRPDDVLEEARELIGAGVRELVLVAEDSTAWGRDMGLELPHLVEALAELEGPHRLRVMYAYPNRFPWQLAPLLRDHPRVVPYLDIPVQHVATDVLRAMRRAGSGDQVRKILDRLLEEVPGITLRTTLLVGFPSETDAHVTELADFVRAYCLGRLGVFTYSREEGTPGYELEGAVDEARAVERLAEVLRARDEVLRASQTALIGSELEVLVDEVHGGPEPWLVARAAMDAPEVDLVAEVALGAARGAHPAVGERLRVRATGLDEALNLICVPLGHTEEGRAGDRGR
jgi:ribosomal protein S12 methylthiotransferase